MRSITSLNAGVSAYHDLPKSPITAPERNFQYWT